MAPEYDILLSSTGINRVRGTVNGIDTKSKTVDIELYSEVREPVPSLYSLAIHTVGMIYLCSFG